VSLIPTKFTWADTRRFAPSHVTLQARRCECRGGTYRDSDLSRGHPSLTAFLADFHRDEAASHQANRLDTVDGVVDRALGVTN